MAQQGSGGCPGEDWCRTNRPALQLQDRHRDVMNHDPAILMVNAGAIAAVSLVDAKGRSRSDGSWCTTISRDFAGAEVAGSRRSLRRQNTRTAWSNRAIANLLYNYGRLYADPEESLRVYTRQCSIGVNTKDLAMMGATFANGGAQSRRLVGACCLQNTFPRCSLSWQLPVFTMNLANGCSMPACRRRLVSAVASLPSLPGKIGDRSLFAAP